MVPEPCPHPRRAQGASLSISSVRRCERLDARPDTSGSQRRPRDDVVAPVTTPVPDRPGPGSLGRPDKFTDTQSVDIGPQTVSHGLARVWHDQAVAVKIREARPEEFMSISALTIDAYTAIFGADDLWDYRDELADVAGRAASADVLVAVEGATALGSVTYVPGPSSPLHEFDDPDASSIRMLAVAPEAQGRGVGHALAAACVDRARAAGRHRVILYSTDPMVIARAMYERMGFVRDASRDWAFEREDGSVVVLRCYALELGAADSP
jgi:ribosomal protein S18 acetylase RimI-like enzyme